ncbi:hypothetical protein I3J13_20575 [Agrobacterium sp. MOPV5]|uniref:hypothetical protein n=1 Tax=Agrobacterium leguminum TaxID=2792015 RepID=UPI0018C312D2|nr:hypothetical protein [Agrobacterium leguminum]MBG0511176.1 hypothetical protein [Agrobacterium leguminum]
MTVNIPSAWHLRLTNLRNQHPSRMRDIALSHLVDEDFDSDDEKNIKELLLSFISDIDTSCCSRSRMPWEGLTIDDISRPWAVAIKR